MYINRCLNSFVLPLIVLLAFSFQVQAVDSAEHKSHMFVFQEKLAKKGNDQAQYKIAFMYEVGEGISQDLSQAKKWYTLAAKAGNKNAKNRLEYLQITKNGFDKKINNAWLGEVRSGAFANEPESLFLMGQIYQYGLGVKKDLDKALEIMYRLGSEGDVIAYQQIAIVEAEQQAMQAKRNKARAKARAQANARAAAKAQALAASKKQQEAQWKKNVVATAVVASRAPVPVLPKEKVAVTPESKAAILAQVKAAQKKAEKRAKYEAVMRALAEEQLEINRLQESVQGDEDEVASSDEEF